MKRAIEKHFKLNEFLEANMADDEWNALEPCLTLSEIEKVIDGLKVSPTTIHYMKSYGMRVQRELAINKTIDDAKEELRKAVDDETKNNQS